MSRRSMDPAQRKRQVTIYLDDDLVQVVDTWMNNFGLDTRAVAVMALIRAGASAVPLDSAIFEISQASVREHRKFFTDSLIRFFEDQVHLLKGTRR